MKTTTKAKQIQTVNGVSYFHAGGGKWNFSGRNKGGVEYTKIERVHGSENAERVAAIIGGGLKRCKNDKGIDEVARHQIQTVIGSAKTFRGIQFSQAFPLNVAGRGNIDRKVWQN